MSAGENIFEYVSLSQGAVCFEIWEDPDDEDKPVYVFAARGGDAVSFNLAPDAIRSLHECLGDYLNER